jgi:triacylglycerol lipase
MNGRALKYAMLSDSAYSAAPTIGADCAAASAVISSSADGLTIGFPGTDNAAGVATDIDALIRDAGRLGCVHRGIYDALDSRWGDLGDLAPDILYGHSLGAAIALMAAARFCVAGMPPKEVYAFEPPKVSIDAKMRQIFEDHGVEVFLTRNGNDIVPCLPLIPFVDWQHPADVVRIGIPKLDIPNIEDHFIKQVIIGVKAYEEDNK